jgi:hypothetical protein
MTTIWERVNTALTPLALPMAASAYIVATGVAIPDTYLVYFVFSIDPELHADNEEILRSEAVQVSIYNKTGNASLPDVIGAMIIAGFTFIGGRELDYDTDTKHFGIAFDFEYLEEL